MMLPITKRIAINGLMNTRRYRAIQNNAHPFRVQAVFAHNSSQSSKFVVAQRTEING
eukprot:m.366987 g.366987  ORF g.366987 m.366987 type:complete len:57 (-) comp38586_c0_seq1:9-179(-)